MHSPSRARSLPALSFSIYTLSSFPFSILPFHIVVFLPFLLRRHSLKGEFPFCNYLNRPEREKSINSLAWHLRSSESRSINRRLTLPLFTRITLTRRMNDRDDEKLVRSSLKKFITIYRNNLKIAKNLIAYRMTYRIIMLRKNLKNSNNICAVNRQLI